MRLSEVLSGIEEIQIVRNQETEVVDIAYDSRKVVPNGMFVAIPGFKEEGHNHIEEAIQKGATAVALEEGHYDVDAIPSNVAVVICQDTRSILPKMACNFYHHPSRDLKVVGVTGTKGKTTTTYMIKAILEHAGKRWA